MYHRQGLDPYPLVGWKKVHKDECEWFVGPNGKTCSTLKEAVDVFRRSKAVAAGQGPSAKETLSFLERFLKDVGGAKEDVIHTSKDAGQQDNEALRSRVTVTTSTVED